MKLKGTLTIDLADYEDLKKELAELEELRKNTSMSNKAIHSAVQGIITDIQCRTGIGSSWDKIDRGYQGQMRGAWFEIIKKEIKE